MKAIFFLLFIITVAVNTCSFRPIPVRKEVIEALADLEQMDQALLVSLLKQKIAGAQNNAKQQQAKVLEVIPNAILRARDIQIP